MLNAMPDKTPKRTEGEFPEVMDRTLAAEYLGIKPRTLAFLLTSGELRAGRIVGKKWRCHIDELRAYILAKPENTPEPPAPPNKRKPRVVRARPKPPDMTPYRKAPGSESGELRASNKRRA